MNKTKILTSLSALAAVFVFNGNALAAQDTMEPYVGVYNPSCSGNQYTLKYVNKSSVENFWDQFESNDCVRSGSSGGGVCIPAGGVGWCPALGSELTYTYGAGSEVLLSDPNGCTGDDSVYSFTAWKVVSTTSGVNFEKTVAKNVPINDEFFKMDDGRVVSNGTQFEVYPVDVTLNGYDFVIECTHSSEYVPSTVAIASDIPTTIQAGVSFNLTNAGSGVPYCNVNGYTITGWEYQVSSGISSPDYTAVADPSKFTVKGAILEDSTIRVRPKYAPNSYTVRFLSKSGSAHDTLTYTNPGKAGNNAVWKRNSTAVTTANLPTTVGYVLRAMCTNTVDDATQTSTVSLSSLCGTMVTRASATSFVSSTLPKNWVLVANRDFKSVWAKDCDPVDAPNGQPSAVCSVTLTPSTGAVEYCNACMAGFNSTTLPSLGTVEETTCPANK